MSKVACVKVNSQTLDPNSIFRSVAKVMSLLDWNKYLVKGTVILKINAVWDQLYPSCTTTPMVIEGVLRVLLGSGKYLPSDITITDTDTAAVMRADKSFRIEGIELLAKKYHVSLVNLSGTKFQEVSLGGIALHHVKISSLLLRADNIITLPVLKTHSYSGMTGALKNQWGCIHDLRHNHHLVLHQAIVDVNKFFQPKMRLAIMDGLFGMEGQGPKTGNPMKIGYIFASPDLVALDSAAISVMGLNPETIKHVNLASKSGLGSTRFQVLGNPLPQFHFRPANTSNIVMGTEMRLRHFGPLLEKMMFDGHSPILLFLRYSAKIYYDLWYSLVGKNNAAKMMKTNYGKIWQKRYLNFSS